MKQGDLLSGEVTGMTACCTSKLNCHGSDDGKEYVSLVKVIHICKMQ